MKNKKMISMMLTLILFLIAVPAMAMEKEPTIQLNGKMLQLTDSKPILKEGRVFVPFRVVLEALGAEIEYDAALQEIVAVKDNRKLQMQIGNPIITLTVNGTEAVVSTDAPSFIQNARTYVPVRFVAQAMDCKVGWDSQEQTVIILDMAQIRKEISGSYQLMDKLQAYAQKNLTGNYELQGRLSFVNDNGMEEKELKAEMTGQTSAETIKLKIVLEPDTMSLAHSLLKEQGRLTAEGERLLNVLETIEIDLLADKQKEKVYLASDLLKILYDLEDKWYQFDLQTLTANEGLNYQQLTTVNKTEKISVLIEKLLTQISLTDSQAAAADLRSIYMLDEAYNDEQFEKENDVYFGRYMEKINEVSMEMMTKILMHGQQIRGYESSIKVLDGATKLEIMNAEKDQTYIWQINLETNEEIMKLEGELSYLQTSKAFIQPPKDYTVFSSL